MDNKTTHLKLVKSFNEGDYKYPLSIDISYDPANDPADRIFRFMPDYEEDKIKALQALYTAEIRRTMLGCPADDYYIIPTGNALHVSFKHKKDRDYVMEDLGIPDPAENASNQQEKTAKAIPEEIIAAATRETTPPKLTRDAFKIVSDFSFEEYPYRFAEKFEYPHDGQCRLTTIHPVQAAVNSARIDDYKILETLGAVELHLKTSEDAMLFQMAIQADRKIEHQFIQAEEGYDVRKLKKHVRHLKKFARDMGFGSDIKFEINPPEKQILLFASGKSPYFQFCQVARHTGLLQKYAPLQRKNPEFIL